MIREFVARRVRDFPNRPNPGPGKHGDPVSQITLGFQFDQAGWVALVFDTRPVSEPDGEWQSYIPENLLACEHWFTTVDRALETGLPVAVTRHDGSTKTMDHESNEASWAECFGILLKDVLIDARDNGVFARLPLASRCIMGVEEHDGYYGWPGYDKRLEDGHVS